MSKEFDPFNCSSVRYIIPIICLKQELQILSKSSRYLEEELKALITSA